MFIQQCKPYSCQCWFVICLLYCCRENRVETLNSLLNWVNSIYHNIISPQIVLDKFFILQTLMRIHTTFTSQHLSVESVAPSAAVWLKYKVGVLRSQFLGLGRWDLYQLKAHSRLSITSQYKRLRYLPLFGWNSNVKLWPQCAPPPLLPFGG